jgi:DNA-binding SARP family transcriptional activator/tetratricopeptide (TPR) repeat protein
VGLLWLDVIPVVAIAAASGSRCVMAEFRLMGPVEVWANGQRVDSGQPRQRLVLAALLADANRLVMAETLVSRVWGDTPPAGARRALHAHIARVRQVLARATAPEEQTAVLAYRSGGYVLEVEPDQVDVHRFRRLVARARNVDVGHPERLALLREALDLWRGEPLAGLPGGWAAWVRDGWHRRRLDAVVAWAREELEANNSGVVIESLTDLIGTYPLAEPLTAMLMRALAAAGRSTEALDCYATLRRRMADEIGTDPAPDLQTLQRAVLRGDLGVGPAPAVPAQLPPDVRGFTGRRMELARLDAVTVVASERKSTAVVITAVSGIAGIGKTALAVHWAHGRSGRFPDGQLYINLRGFDPTGSPMTPAEALRTLLNALAVPPERIPPSVEAQASMYCRLLAGRHMLVLLDNARDAEQVRPLLPGAYGPVVLVTSRNQLSGLAAAEGAEVINVDLLSVAEAKQMLVHRLGASRVTADPTAVDEIIKRCAGLPLALAIASARAAIHPDFTLAALAGELQRSGGELDAFTAGDATTDVRTVLSWSYHTLSDRAARLFRMLGDHPGPDISVPAAAHLAGAPVKQVRPLLAELGNAHLLTEDAPGRYIFHDLLRAYANDLAAIHDTDNQRRAAVQRLLDYYLYTARPAAMLLNPHRDPITLSPPSCEVTIHDLTDSGQALAWFTAEHRVLLACVDRAADWRLDAHAWQLAWTTAAFLDHQRHWQDLARTMGTALGAAQRLAEPTAEAHVHRSLGHACVFLGQDGDAHTHYRHALHKYGQLDNQAGQAHIHLNISVLLGQRGRNSEALHHSQRALDLFARANHQPGCADALNNIGWYEIELGHAKQALVHCEQALALQQESGDRSGQASTWDSLGYAHGRLGDYPRATACYERAIELRRHLNDRGGEAEVLDHLGDMQLAAGRRNAARRTWQRALAILDHLRQPGAAQVRAKLDHLHDIGAAT